MPSHALLVGTPVQRWGLAHGIGWRKGTWAAADVQFYGDLFAFQALARLLQKKNLISSCSQP